MSDDTLETGKHRVAFRRPTVEDGPAVWRLAFEARALEDNTAYAYLLLCRDFADTCVVADGDAGLLGFVLGYRMPAQPDTVFVWQVGVSADARGRGIAGRLLDNLLRSPGCRGVRFLETTVTPSNEASRALFHSFARRANAQVEESQGFPAGLFPEDHEPERRLRIGPLEISRTTD